MAVFTYPRLEKSQTNRIVVFLFAHRSLLRFKNMFSSEHVLKYEWCLPTLRNDAKVLPGHCNVIVKVFYMWSLVLVNTTNSNDLYKTMQDCIISVYDTPDRYSM